MEWISVKDRLPEFVKEWAVNSTTNNVLLFGSVHGVSVGYFKKENETGKVKGEGFGFVDSSPTHWMPLPDSPKQL